MICRTATAVLLSFVAAMAAPLAIAAPPAADDPVEAALADAVDPRMQGEVLVLGSWHLRAFDELEPAHLASTLSLLDRYAPTRIAIEALPADEIALLLERAKTQPSAQQVLDMFGKRMVDNGRTMQAALGRDRLQAETRAQELLAGADPGMAPATRSELVRNLLAAYEYDSAVLQWSYLSPEQRKSAALPAKVRESLDARLASKGEIVTVATALARRRGLQRLYPIDSQYEAVRTLAFPEATLEAVFGDASIEAERQRPERRRVMDLPRPALESGDLLGLYRQINSPAVQETDAGQWRPWLTMRHPSGVDRFRYAMWELRNKRMAANIMDAAASTRPERVLVVVGFAHKSYLERELAPQLGLRLARFDALEGLPASGYKP